MHALKSNFTPHFVKFRHSHRFTSYICTIARILQECTHGCIGAERGWLWLASRRTSVHCGCVAGGMRELWKLKGGISRIRGLTPEGGKQNNCNKHVYVQCACWLCLCGDGVWHVRCAWVKRVRRRAKYLFEGAQPYADGVVLVHVAKNVFCAVLLQCHVHLRRKHEKKDAVREFRVGHRRPAVGGHAGVRGTAIRPAGGTRWQPSAALARREVVAASWRKVGFFECQ